MKKLVILAVVFVLFLSACSKANGKPEKERFIDATVEVTCLVFQAEDLLDPSLEQKTKDVFAKHGFDVEDAEGMQQIAAKYEKDADVQDAITKALEKCAADLTTNTEKVEATPDVATEENEDNAAEETVKE